MTSTGTESTRLTGRIIESCARHPWLTLFAAVAMLLWGMYSLRGAPLDAIPDLSDTQVIIFTEWTGQSPDLIEDQVTYPISSAMLSVPNVKFVRGQSMFGMSFVYAIFEDGTDIYWARSRVLEYLNTVSGRLPDDVNPTLGPDATGVGWVYQYALVDRTGRHDLADLRSLQDWHVRYALESVPGVAEVASVGGYVREYQVQVDPQRLRGYGVTLNDVSQAVQASNADTGGNVLEIAGHEQMVRSRGYIETLDDLRNIPVKVDPAGVPTLVRDLGVVTTGPAPRRGLAELDGEGEVAGGIVIMRYGENALRVIDAVEERLADVRTALPEGVELVVTYDRSELIRDAIGTLRATLIFEMFAVSLVLFIFLLNVRSSLVPVLTLPVAVALAFIPMYYQGLTANIMSLGGIAIAIGAMVDASIVLMENIQKRLEQWQAKGKEGPRLDVLIRAMQEVGPTLFFSLLVITVSFLPVFTLEAQEGRLFKPLAFTKTYSMGFAAILAVTLTPALAALLIRGRIAKENAHPINRFLVRSYLPVVRWVVCRPRRVVLLAVAIILLTVPAFMKLGTEFMPPLNEGVILYMPTAPPGMSMTEASAVVQSMNQQLKAFPEVDTVFGKMGRAETATDPAPLGMAETVITLKPRDQWRPGMTWDKLLEEMDEEMQYPGMPNIWWMPIQTRTEMLTTGVRSPLGIQIFAQDLESIERTSIAVEQAVANVPGTRSAFAERSTGAFYVDFRIKREQAARFGLRVDDINQVVATAVGGMPIGETVEGRARYPITVRYARDYRETPDVLGDILVDTPTGAQIPISQVADIEFVTGPPLIRSEDGALVGFVFVDTDRPIGNYVADAKQVVAEQVSLPTGTRLAWIGQYQHLERAQQRLLLVLPLTLLLVLFLLYWNTKSLAEMLIVILALPFSLVGAIWLLFFLDFNMSVAVWVGLIALAGLDMETSVIMLLYLKLARRRRAEEGRLDTKADLQEAIVEGASQRIRPKVMTVLTTLVALTPILLATGTGADVMQRIAAPMVGGILTSFLLELTVYPAIYSWWKGKDLPPGEPQGEDV